MSVSQKTLSVLLLSVVALMAVLYVVARISTLKHFTQLEEDEIQATAERVRGEVEDAASELARTTNDYGAWDRMYRFVSDRNVKAIAEEFQDGTLQGLRVNSVTVIDPGGEIIYFKRYDFLHHSEVKASNEEQMALVSDSWVRSVQSHSTFGFMQLPSGPVLVAGCPIVTTDGKGPVRGTIVMTVSLDSAFVDDRQRITRSTMRLDTIPEARLSAGSRRAYATLNSSGQEFWVTPLDEDRVAAYSILNDVHGSPLLLLRVTEQRLIYQRGLAALKTFLVGLGLAGLVFCFITLLLLRGVVLSRLSRLSSEIKKIEKQHSISEPLAIQGNDEIADVGNAINLMLEAVQKSQSALHLLADNIRQVFWVKDAETQHVTYVSPAYEKIWGQTCESLYADSDSWRKFVHEEDRALVQEMIKTQREGGQGEIEFRIVKPDGGIGWIWGRYFPVADGAGHIRQYIGLMEEITEYKTAEEVLLHSQKELWDAMVQRRERLQAIGGLAAGIAHEIKTPTQFVGDNVRYLRDSFSGLVQLLDSYDQMFQQASQGKVEPKQLEEVKAAREKADLKFLREQIPSTLEQTLDGITRVASIAKALKEFSHIESDRALQSVDLNAALETTITISRNEWKYVAAMETVFGNLPLVQCHAGELNQVFLNLLVNAAHAIEEAVRGTTRKGRIRVSTKAAEGWVEIAVSDSGIGIPDEIKDRIFEPFFTTKGPLKGTGQGLPLAKTLVDKHGGTIRFESAVGKGTTFFIRIPVNGVPAEAAPEAAAAAHQA